MSVSGKILEQFWWAFLSISFQENPAKLPVRGSETCLCQLPGVCWGSASRTFEHEITGGWIPTPQTRLKMPMADGEVESSLCSKLSFLLAFLGFQKQPRNLGAIGHVEPWTGLFQGLLDPSSWDPLET